jgi:Protein of unknown function (DUF1559)
MWMCRLRAAVGVVFVIATTLSVLPACNKKKNTRDKDPDTTPPARAPNTGGGVGPPPEPGMPSPPGPGPHLTYNRASAQESMSNLKQIGLAFHNYHDSTGSLPHAIADSTGKPGLSWRVTILPQIGQANLYKSFKLNEPWNSEHNKQLVTRMPTIYAPPRVSTNGYTYYRSFTGEGAIMPPPTQRAQPGQPFRGLKLFAILDGTSNTFMLAEAAEPVIWTKPEELPFAPGKPPRLGGAVFAEGFHAVFCDGAVRFLRRGIDARNLSNAIQTNDGQIVEID